jgi:hypothetical protein
MMLKHPPSGCELPSKVCVRQGATARQERVHQGNKSETKVPSAVAWNRQRLGRIVAQRGDILCTISRLS